MSDEYPAAKASIEAAQKRAHAKIEDLRWILSQASGRRIMTRILAKAGLFRGTFDHESDRLTSFREGERAIGLWLFKELAEVNPEATAALLVDVQNPDGLTSVKSDRLSA